MNRARKYTSRGTNQVRMVLDVTWDRIRQNYHVFHANEPRRLRRFLPTNCDGITWHDGLGSNNGVRRVQRTITCSPGGWYEFRAKPKKEGKAHLAPYACYLTRRVCLDVLFSLQTDKFLSSLKTLFDHVTFTQTTEARSRQPRTG